MARTINRLTARQVAGLKAPGWHADGAGLYLRIQNSGARSWVLVSNKGGKRVERGLGSAAEVSLAEARSKARTPLGEAVEIVDVVPTFGDFADEIVDALVPGFKNAKHRQQWRNTLATLAKPLRAKRVDEIDTDDVLGVLRPIWRKTPETASRLRGRIERILGAARAAGHIKPPYENPARWKEHLEHFLPRRRRAEKGHHEAMPWEDVPAFLAKLRDRQATGAVALELTILTALRTNEALQARWSEIDLKAGIWTIPAERMKLEIEHRVPLTPRAIEIIESLGPGEPGAYLFPGSKPGKPLSDMSMLMVLRRMALTATVHGFRSSFRDWAGDASPHPRELAEMALAHAVGDETERAYRRGDALAKRRQLMLDWEAHCLSKISAAKAT